LQEAKFLKQILLYYFIN